MAKLNTFLTRSGVEGIRQGKPWILSKQIKPSYHLPGTPAVIPLGEHWFWYSPHSDIRLRRMGPATRFWPEIVRGDEEKGYEPFREPIKTVNAFSDYFSNALTDELYLLYLHKHRALGGEKALRWVFGDSDGFGGLVVDIFGQYAVVQLQSAPIEYFWEALKHCLCAAWERIQQEWGVEIQPLQIIEHRDGKVRHKEGLEVITFSAEDTPVSMQWNGLLWNFNPAGNQKTGAYLDQKDNHNRAVSWAQKLQCKQVWDICSFEGGFSIHLAVAGLEVVAVDSSEKALGRCVENATLNNVQSRVTTVKSDAFDFLRQKHKESQKVDMIILDPPALAPTKQSIPSALKAYRELNLRALHCIKSGGLLVSCSCSHVITTPLFLEMLSQAEHHTRRKIRILEIAGPACDHTPSLQLPESDYLQAYFLQVI